MRLYKKCYDLCVKNDQIKIITAPPEKKKQREKSPDYPATKIDYDRVVGYKKPDHISAKIDLEKAAAYAIAHKTDGEVTGRTTDDAAPQRKRARTSRKAVRS
jgi:hypothetical protein